MVEFNNTARDYPSDQCIHQLFEQQVERTPEAIALVFGDQTLTYQQLNRRASQLAHYLHHQGVAPDTLVGLCLERSLKMIISLLAILKAGGAYVPLDPSYPTERLVYMVQDAQVSLVITQAELVPQLPVTGIELICLDRDQHSIEQELDENLICKPTPENLAYVIYTSGSTGQPKGVLLTHRGICNLVTAEIELFHLHPSSRVVQFASLSFDVSVSEIFTTLCAGATLYLASKATLLPGYCLAEFLQSHAITHADLPPSALSVMPDLPLPTLAVLIVGGEACSQKLIRRWAVGRRFFNAYGPTETTVDATLALCTPESEPVIGRPLANKQAYILDAALQLVPIGASGELHIGGVGLARGYLNRPELTREKFIPHPFEPGERLYKTGDLARYQTDGTIEFLGRLDQQVKIRGYRIELGEIETVLEQHPAVQQAVVLVRADNRGDKQLLAYVVPHSVDENENTILTVRRFLQGKLPDYMQPTAFGVVEQMPLTPSDKIDRAALAKRPTQNYFSVTKTEVVAPRTPEEKTLERLWKEILELEHVSIYDNFFELGGNSLKIILLLNRLHEQLGKGFQIVDLFNAPTIAEFAKRLDQKSSLFLKAIDNSVSSAKTGTISYPASLDQERFWYQVKANPTASYAWWSTEVFHLTGLLNVAVLEKSFNEIICRHEILRTTLQETDRALMQIVSPAVVRKLSVVDLEHLPQAEQFPEIEKLTHQNMLRPTDLEQDGWLQLTLFRLREDFHVLQIDLRPLLSDDQSISIVIQELTTLYEAFLAGKPSPLPDLTFQYGDYAIAQRQFLTSEEVLQAKQIYWQKWLSHEPEQLELPIDPSLDPFLPKQEVFRAGYLLVQLPIELTQALKLFSQKNQVTLFTTLLMAFAALLYCYNKSASFVLGFPATGRDHSKLMSLIGRFGKMLLLRVNLEEKLNFLELLHRVQTELVETIANQDIPFGQLSKLLQLKRRYQHPPARVFVDFLVEAPLQSWALPNLTITTMPLEDLLTQGDLTWLIWEEGAASESSLHLSWQYKKDVFVAETIVRMSKDFQILLEAIVAEPEQAICHLSNVSNWFHGVG